MILRKYLLTLLFVLASTIEMAGQGLVVKNFYLAERDFTANSGSTLVPDVNDEPCALIKVRTNEKGFTFDAGRLLPVEQTEEQTKAHPLEIYVWVQSGVKRLSIGHKQLGNLYDYDLGMSLEAGKTYILELVSGEVQTVIKQARTTGYVVFQLSPANAVVELNGEMLETNDGTATKMMNFGTYQYTVKAPNHLLEVGRVEVKDAKQTVNVSLKPNYTSITLTTENGAEIWVNGERKGSGSWTGNLGEGAYLFETKKSNHRDGQLTKNIVVANGPQTIRIPAPTPIMGDADINSSPAVADIYIDGTKVGQTPFIASNLLVGSHSVKISRNGYADYTATLTVREGETATLMASLKKEDTAEELYRKWEPLDKEKKYDEAIIYLRKAAELGHAISQYNLGFYYHLGYGVTKDGKEGNKWYHKAAEQGYAKALYMIGVGYENGYDVTIDKAEAVKWYLKAAEQGYASAQLRLAWCYEEGKGVAQNYTEAVKWYRKAEKEPGAQYGLGVCYYYGRGVTQNKQEAKKWLQKAAQGTNDYVKNLAKLFLQENSF